MISFDQFKTVEIRIGEILSVEKVENADKLLKLMVNFGFKPAVSAPVSAPASAPLEPEEGVIAKKEETTAPVHEEREVRQIISGIATYFPNPQELIGVKCAFVTNLEPRIIRGLQSNGMILASGGGAEPFTLLRANPDVLPGAMVK